MDGYDAIVTRRSVRRFDGRAVPTDVLERLLAAGATAPAPHHTRPWRFVVLETADARRRLHEAMGAAWRRDLEGDEVASERIEALLTSSRGQIEDAPSLVLCCAVSEGLRAWPDKRRRRAEWRMAIQSVGGALEAILVAAHANGIAGYWISAPLFCADAVRDALDLPQEYEAQALIALGYAAADYTPRPRPAPDMSELVQRR